MEIQIMQSTVPIWRDLACLTKSVQISMESVVPDTKDDIGRILSVRPEIYLKSKDLNAKSAVVGGLLAVNILYINDSGSAVRHFRAEENFRLEYELPMADDYCVLQSRLHLAGLKARVMNPRKVGLDAEIACELCMSRSESLCVEQTLSQHTTQPVVHIQETAEEISTLVCVTEKSFSINEQLSLPADQPQPGEIASAEVCYRIDSRECLGTRLLIKGSAELSICFEPASDGPALTVPYQLPFSQMIDLADEEADDAELWIETTSSWLELMETLDDRHMLDFELHALIQVRAEKKLTLRCISDAYCNQMPCECALESLTMPERCSERRMELQTEGKLEIADKFQELLGIYATPLRPDTEQRSLAMDLLYRDKDGKLNPLRRMLALRMPDGSDIPPDAKLTVSEITQRQEGSELILTAVTALTVREQTQKTIRRVSSMELKEDQAFDCSAFPSLTAVWTETETVWELAKLYHSSPEAIREMNGAQDGNPVFIPKTK